MPARDEGPADRPSLRVVRGGTAKTERPVPSPPPRGWSFLVIAATVAVGLTFLALAMVTMGSTSLVALVIRVLAGGGFVACAVLAVALIRGVLCGRNLADRPYDGRRPLGK